jgi:hypothetical protein
MSIFTLYHKDGTRQVIRGADPQKALLLADYGAGEACALAFWVQGEDHSHHWDHEQESWVRKENATVKTNKVSSAVCMATALQDCLGQMHRLQGMVGYQDSAFSATIAAGEAALDQFHAEIESARAHESSEFAERDTADMTE